MRISDWSSDVCSSDLEPGRELHEPPGGALRLVLEVALSLLERGSWTLPSWHVEQALAARAARELGWTVAPIRPPESGELGLRLQNKLSSKVLQRSEEHTSELQSLMRISYAVFCLKKKK